MKILAAALAFACLISPALAAADWNGTWAGNWQNGDGVQIVMAGNDAITLYLHGDYLSEDLHAAVSAGGKTLTITWRHGHATLTRDGDDTARAVLAEPGHTDLAFTVKRDP